MGGWTSAGWPLPGDDSGSAVPPRNAGNEADARPGRAFPAAECDDDFDDGHFEWLVREMDVGRLLPPPESAIEGPAISISLGNSCDLDPESLEAMCGPDGLGGQSVGVAFGDGRAADMLRPGPILAALTAQVVSRAVSPPAVPGPVSRSGAPDAVSRPCLLSDNELVGALQAARRLANLAAYQQTVVIAEFARRRQEQFEAAKAKGRPVGCRDGEFPGEELAMELVETRAATGARIDTAIELVARLPRTLAGMADGLIDLARACAIAARTQAMSDIDAGHADAVLAAAAPGLRPDQLARKAAALELKLAPGAVAARKKLARELDQRVEARREESGNASLAGRELDTADVIASKAHIGAFALRLRSAGLQGTLGHLRALVLLDLTQERNPFDRITPPPSVRSGATPSSPDEAAPDGKSGWRAEMVKNAGHRHGLVDDCGDDDAGGDNCGGDEPGDAGSLRRDPFRSGAPVPLPALINVLVPAGTLIGWGTAPAQAASWGLLDADESRTLIEAASRHPRTRWCFTLTAPDDTAVAHACASGQHPWNPLGPMDPPESPGLSRPPDQQTRQENQFRINPAYRPTAQQSRATSAYRPTVQLADFLGGFNITFEPIARCTCDHRHAEDRYVPSRKLKHLLRARNQTCTAPACNAQAVFCDIDHTIPYPDGPTDECNTNPRCRRHHRTKQSPGWETAQPAPDTTIWTTPSGRTHTTTPTIYEL